MKCRPLGWLVLVVALCALPTPAIAEDRTAEASRILKDLRQLSIEDRLAGYRALDYSGITDDSIFEEINSRLARSYLNAGHDNKKVREVRFMLQALATSGNSKYKAEIEKVIAAGRHVNERARQHAEKALFLLESYKEWNELINRPVPGVSWPRSRAENLLRADDDHLRREGLKRAKELRDSDPQVFETIEAQLNEMLTADLTDPKQQDLAAWYCKTLAFSQNKKFSPILQRAASESFPKKLRKHASKALTTMEDGATGHDDASD